MFQFQDMMVWKVVTPAMPSSEPKYHAMQEVQLRDEHRGKSGPFNMFLRHFFIMLDDI